MNKSWVIENFFFLSFPQTIFKHDLGEATYHQIYTVDTLICYQDKNQR